MATINVYQAQDGSKTYRVRIRRRGEQTQTATFANVKDAKRWATTIEGQMIEGRHFPNKKTPHTLNELLDRYERDIMPKKTEETQRTHGYVITFWRERLGQKLLTAITKGCGSFATTPRTCISVSPCVLCCQQSVPPASRCNVRGAMGISANFAR
jgi:hypothetical protein